MKKCSVFQIKTSFWHRAGASPTTWTTFAGCGTWSDPAAFGTTPFVLNNAVDMATISGQSNVCLRVAALSVSTGAGNRDSIAIDNFVITPVPEPATIVGIAAAGMGLMGFVRRRIRRAVDNSVV